MRTLPRLTLILFAVVLLCAPAAAQAKVFCVHAGAATCSGQDDMGNDLQQALIEASSFGAPGSTNTINISAGTYTPANAGTGFVYNGTQHIVQIIGLGNDIDDTTITGGTTPEVLKIDAQAGSTITDVQVTAPNTTTNGANFHNVAATRIAIALPANSTATGITLNAGVGATDSTMTDSTVTAATPVSSSTALIGAGPGTVGLTKLTINGAKGIVANNGGTVTGHNLRITPRGFGLVADEIGSTLNIDNSLLTYPTTGTGNIALLSEGGATLNARNLTLIGGGTTPTGITVNGNNGNHSAATVTDTIFNGFTKDVDRTNTVAGIADLTLDHDIVNSTTDPGATIPGTTTFTSNVNADPKFANKNNNDFRPLYNSPAIDSGTPCSGLCLTIPDMNGLARPVNGTIDRGAFEYARRPPSVNAVASETQRFIGGVSSFTAQGTDPDNDPLTYAWVFDDGATATGAMVNHQFATLGFHNATVTATDPTGQTATATATTQIITPVPAPGPGGFPPSGGGGTPSSTPLTLTGLKLSNTKFAISKSKTATSAKAKTPKGTTIRFTLSKPATVKFAFEQELKGVKAGGKCVKKSKRHSHGTSCKLLELKGTIIRRNLAAGLRSVAFSGRIGSKPLHRGSFRLTATATDSAGARVAKHAEFKIA